MTTKTKILTTSIMAITILGLIIPTNMASATLIGDIVTVELVGATAGNGVNPQTDTVVVGADSFLWGSSGACGSPDESVSVDIEDSTITVSWGEFTGFFLFPDDACNILDPITLDITDLDWVGMPGGIVTGITLTSNLSVVPTSGLVTGDHSVQISTSLYGIGDSGFVEYELETNHTQVCSADEEICKSVEIADDDDDGIIEVGELITYTFHFVVSNNSGENWTDVVVKDNFGGDLDVIEPPVINEGGTVTLTQKGATAKESLSWAVGSLADGETKELVLTVVTDENPAGNQEYTSCSYHDINSGANLKYKDGNNKKQSASTEAITVSVLTDNAEGDCDGDGFSDEVELDLGTDPHVTEDFPGCGGINTVDECIDGDGIATPLPGSFSAVWGTPLTTWPTGVGVEGIDWFDNDISGTWTPGDDLHLEDFAGACTTGIRNGVHDLGFDCKVLDIDGSLFTPQPVDCDLEVGAFCTVAHSADLLTVGIKFTDGEIAADSLYNNSEDIIQDVNGDGIFN